MSDSHDDVLLTDLYQLTMLQGYFEYTMAEEAVFEFLVRRLPKFRNFLVAAGVEQTIDFLEQFRFFPEQLEWLRGCGHLRSDFIDSLESMRFTGDVHAIPDGTVFFPDEPVIRVTAPIAEAQVVESRLINLMQFQTLIASKAARCVLVAQGKPLVDFGLRRAHGAEAALLAARASYIAGFSGTATVLAGRKFGVPVHGTMAHSFVQAHEDEAEAFEHFARANPDNVVLLIDTYDTKLAAAKVVDLAHRLDREGISVKGVRLDSGNLAEHAVAVRQIFDDAGLHQISIFASGNLDEFRLQELTARGAPIDGFGIGSRLAVSNDAPYLECVYKLQEYARIPRRKRSEGKATWPGRKQVYRRFVDDQMAGDIVALEGDPPPDGVPLLEHVMQNGHRIAQPQPLSAHRARARENLAQLPLRLRGLEPTEPYCVEIADSIQQLASATAPSS